MRRLALLLLPLLLAMAGPHPPKLTSIGFEDAGVCVPASATTCRLSGQWTLTGNWNPATDSLKVTWRRTAPTAATLGTAHYTRGTVDTINVALPAAGTSSTISLTVVTYRMGTKDSAVATVSTQVQGPPPPPDAVSGIKIIPASQVLAPGAKTVYCGVVLYQSGARRLIPGSDTIQVCRAALASGV